MSSARQGENVKFAFSIDNVSVVLITRDPDVLAKAMSVLEKILISVSAMSRYII